MKTTPEVAELHRAFLKANDALLTDPQAEVRVRASRFLRDALPPGYDPFLQDGR